MGIGKTLQRAKDAVVGQVEGAMDTVTGKAVLRDVSKFAQEADAINTAIVTRIYEILDRQKNLEQANELVDSKHSATRKLVIASLVLNVFLVCAVVLLFTRLR